MWFSGRLDTFRDERNCPSDRANFRGRQLLAEHAPTCWCKRTPATNRGGMMRLIDRSNQVAGLVGGARYTDRPQLPGGGRLDL
jgi:hypothetical protein